METVFRIKSKNLPRLYHLYGGVRVIEFERHYDYRSGQEEFVFLLDNGIYILRHNRKVKYLRVQAGEVEEFPWFLLRGPHEPAR